MPTAADDVGTAPADAVDVGRIVGAWGVQGAFKVKPHAAEPQALFSSKRWYLRPAPPPAPVLAVPPLLRIVRAREHGEFVVATAHGVDDRDAADALCGATVLVSRASFPTPDAGEFYWVDLIGMAVVDRTGDALGNVAGLIETGPHCVLRVQPGAGAERLVPFVAAYVDDVDVAARRIVVDWHDDY